MNLRQLLIWGLFASCVLGFPKMVSRPVLLFPQKESYLDTIKFVVSADDPEHTPDTPYRLTALCNDYTKNIVEFAPLPIFCTGLPFVGTLSNLLANLQTNTVKLTTKAHIDFGKLGINFELRREVDNMLIAATNLQFDKLESFIIYDRRKQVTLPLAEEHVSEILGRLDGRMRNEFGNWGFSVEFKDRKKLPAGLRLTVQRDNLILEGRLQSVAPTDSALLNFYLKDLTTDLASQEFQVVIGTPISEDANWVKRACIAVSMALSAVILVLVYRQVQSKMGLKSHNRLPAAKVAKVAKPGVFTRLLGRHLPPANVPKKKHDEAMDQSGLALKTEEAEIIISSSEARSDSREDEVIESTARSPSVN